MLEQVRAHRDVRRRGCASRLKNVMGGWPSCCGLPMLQYTTRWNGSEPGLAASCAASSCACCTISPRTAYAAARTSALKVSTQSASGAPFAAAMARAGTARRRTRATQHARQADA
jgi:hypothetical protein